MKATAKLSMHRSTPRKTRLVVDLIRGIQVSTTDLNDTQGWVGPGGAPEPMGTRPQLELAQNGQKNQDNESAPVFLFRATPRLPHLWQKQHLHHL